jgi:hypothetical protein
MKRLEKVSLFEKMASELQVLREEECKGVLGGGNGTYGNPYSSNEYWSMLDTGNWTTGGYVNGMGYVSPKVTITGNATTTNTFSGNVIGFIPIEGMGVHAS